ncbi:MAG TPA: PBP1A family penicillin-binding protein [Actinobacteria bacterium]|nr:PBP1A family penicillin-binding protein [Actinomycetota bacterium]
MRRVLAAVFAFGTVLAACSVEPLPDPGLGDRPVSTVVYAADGSVLDTWYAAERRELVPLERVPGYLVDAVVAIEDERFWSHEGIDLEAIARAVLANVEAGAPVQGGSTITQQYLKNVLLTPEITLDRKLEEAVLALRLEEGLDKEAILERYLNTVYFGAGAYGVATAARTYFGKDVADLDLAEAALLAGLIRAPARTDPFRDPDAALTRRRVVLDKMVELGWLDPEEAAAAAEAPLRLVPDPGPRARYPYFVAEVRRRLLADPRLAPSFEERYDLLFNGGLAIYTTLDPTVQEAAEAAIADVLDDEGDPAAALVAIEPNTGHVLALVGGRDWYDGDDPVAKFNLATQGRRQAGSAFKPFVLAAALEQGLGLDDVFPGGPSVEISTPSGPWLVENYDGAAFPDLTLAEATVFSVNVVYARLIDLIGPERVANLAEAMGITTDLRPLHALALGAEEVTVLDMASAYGTFANGGVHVEPVFVTRIVDRAGVDIYREVPAVAKVLDRTIADRVTAVLTDVVRRGTGQQARIGRPTAGKTGTTQDHADAWFVGYTPELVAAVWVGFPTGTVPMVPPTTPFAVTGGTWPAWIWSRFAAAALAGVPYGSLPTETGTATVSVDVDVSTGFLAGPSCPRAQVHSVRLPADRAPTVVCPIHNPADVGEPSLPDLVGLPLGEAVQRLAELGFGATVEWAPPGPLAPGTVLEQDPPAGADRLEGGVRLLVAGPRPGSVLPTFVGLPLETVRLRADELGLDLVVVTEAEADPEAAAARRGLVWKQEPAAGATDVTGVTVWVNP